MNITCSKIKLVDTFYKADSFKRHNISIILGDVALLRYSVFKSLVFFELTISVYRRFCFIVCVYTYNKGVIRIDSYEMKMVQVRKRHLKVSFFVYYTPLILSPCFICTNCSSLRRTRIK